MFFLQVAPKKTFENILEKSFGGSEKLLKEFFKAFLEEFLDSSGDFLGISHRSSSEKSFRNTSTNSPRNFSGNSQGFILKISPGIPRVFPIENLTGISAGIPPGANPRIPPGTPPGTNPGIPSGILPGVPQ